MIYDLIIIGLGAMGSSAFYHAANDNLQVLGIDQFNPPHQNGSSHGETRITRQALLEGPYYVQLVKKSQEIFKKVQQESGLLIFKQVGGLMMSYKNSEFMNNVIKSAIESQVKFERYSTQAELQKKFPQIKMPDNFEAVLDTSAGILYPENYVTACLDLAQQKANATTKQNTRVLSFDQQFDSNNQETCIKIVTNKNEELYTKKLIIAAGLWNAELLKDLKIPFTILRTQQVWFQLEDQEKQKQYSSDNNFPIFIFEDSQDDIYGFPDVGTGIKIGLHNDQNTIDQNQNLYQIKYGVDYQIANKLKNISKQYIPDIGNSKISFILPCHYTVLPDHNFLLDFHPKSKNIVIMSPCSGHGFKYSAYLGRVALNMLQTKQVYYDKFKLDRFFTNNNKSK